MSKNQNLIIDTKYKELQKILPLISTLEESAAKAALSTTLEGVDRSTIKKIFKRVRNESNVAKTNNEKKLLRQLHAYIDSYLKDPEPEKEKEVKNIILGTGNEGKESLGPTIDVEPTTYEVENEGKIDLGKISLSEDEFRQYFGEHLSYKKAFGKIRYPSEENRKKLNFDAYAKIIKYIENDKELKHKFEDTVDKLREVFDEDVHRMGFFYELSPFAMDDSRIKRDLAKQMYYFFGKDIHADAGYRIADPLSDSQLQREIVDRHIGREAENRFIPKQLISDESIKAFVNDEKNKNQTHKLKSSALTILGKMAREELISEGKETAPTEATESKAEDKEKINTPYEKVRAIVRPLIPMDEKQAKSELENILDGLDETEIKTIANESRYEYMSPKTGEKEKESCARVVNFLTRYKPKKGEYKKPQTETSKIATASPAKKETPKKESDESEARKEFIVGRVDEAEEKKAERQREEKENKRLADEEQKKAKEKKDEEKRKTKEKKDEEKRKTKEKKDEEKRKNEDEIEAKKAKLEDLSKKLDSIDTLAKTLADIMEKKKEK